MGHLKEQSSQSIDVLTGAFMMIRKTIIDITGGFDERFFMYAEDIDLSFRIKQIGYQNYYLPQSTIIHFKGESTRRDIKYVKAFYGAMELFIKKHFENDGFSLQLYFLKLGIYLRQMMAYFHLLFKKSESKARSQPSVFIKGSSDDKQYWKLRLEKKKILIVENQMEAKEILFCEGLYCSWKSIIAEITKTNVRFTYKFHGAGTHSAIGSNSSRSQGDLFEI
jgi:N-acetylglucosaminyl-diphospho-decaprenol L-rhamnosyltransferase